MNAKPHIGQPDPDTPLRLSDAVRIAFPLGGMTVSGLRSEAARGRLVIEKIANKQFVTLRAIEMMWELCRAEQPDQGYGLSPKKSTPPAGASGTRPGSSETARSKYALAALHKTARALKPSSGNTSRKSTAGHAENADVIPIKS
jgi:hypothetical protein